MSGFSPPGMMFGDLVKVGATSLTPIADVGTTNLAWTTAHANDPWAPPTQFPDSNIYGVYAIGATRYVIDPASNTLDSVDALGNVNPNNLNTVLTVATPWAMGFTTIAGCTFDKLGNFYAAQMFTGDIQVAPFATPNSGRFFLGAGQLTKPNGVVAGDDGAIYVTNFSSSQQAGAGQVVRIRWH